MKNTQLNIGWSTTSITPSRPIRLHGQLYYRVSSYVHDPITATALALDNGHDHAILVSMDVVGPFPHHAEKIRAAVDGIDGLNARKITFSATHTHNSSTFSGDPTRESFEQYVGKDVMLKIEEPDDILAPDEAAIFFQSKIIEIILSAWKSRKPGGVSSAADYAVVGFNRRPVFDAGKDQAVSKMYGACSQDSFVRFEGPVDHTIDMIYTWDADRNLTGVLVDVPCPSQVFELHRFISADYWDSARKCIRERLGNIYVLSICGAAGDQNPFDLVRISKYNERELDEWNAQAGEVLRNIDMQAECDGIGERIAEAVMRGYYKAQNYIETNPVFKHIIVTMDLPIRKVSEDDYKAALEAIDAARKKFSPEKRMTSADQVALFEPVGIVKRWEEQQTAGTFSFDTHILRLGRVAIATNPFELFVEYGLRIRARSKAEQVCVCQLTNGCESYLPTQAAIDGGSYSSKPASTKVGPESGDVLAERTIKEINALWI